MLHACCVRVHTPQVWDSFGRLLYQSSPFDYAVTSVAWCPSGDLFAVGTFNNLLLCDRMGWAYSKVHLSTGSIYAISWTADGTQLAAAGGNGSVVFGNVVDIALEDGKMRVTVEDEHKVQAGGGGGRGQHWAALGVRTEALA